MTEPFTLARLLAPIDRARFLTEHWEREALVVHRDDPAYWADLATPDDVNRVLTSRHVHFPSVSMTTASRKMQPEEFTFPSGMVDVARLYKLFSEGCTITLNGFETEHAPLALLCRTMERDLSTRFQTNLYYTPAQAQGFRTHFDTHDVFVLQVAGSKHWTLYESPVELPYRRQDFVPDQHRPGAVTREFVLRAGDMAYVPRGVMHDARTTGEESLHITLGVLFTSWTDLLAEALGLAGLSDVALRRALPVGFARPDFDRGPAREEFRALLQRLAARADFDAALDHFVDDLVATRNPLLPDQLAQLRALPGLTAATPVAPREGLLYRLLDEGDDVVLHCYGNAIRLPGHVRPDLAWMLTQPRFTAAELPGTLDPPGRLTLVRRLVREGVLRVVA